MKSTIRGLILSAGFSSRMDGFKPLVRYKNKTFIGHIIDKLSSVCDEILIVTGYNSKTLEESVRVMCNRDEVLTKIDFVYNHNFQNGMFTSIKTGVQSFLPKMSEFDYVMLHLVDQPHVSRHVYEKLAEKGKNERLKVIIPSYNMKAGHPILLSKDVIEEIAVAPDSENLRNILRKWRDQTTYVEIMHETVLQDVNTPEERKEYLE